MGFGHTCSRIARVSQVVAASSSQAGPGVSRGARSRLWRSGRVLLGGGVAMAVLLVCLISLWWTARESSRSPLYYDAQTPAESRHPPTTSSLHLLLGADKLGRSLLGRALVGGAVSLGIGVMAASISVALGLTVGLLAGYAGGWLDHALMRVVDILYGLPFVLMVVLLKVALDRPMAAWFDSPLLANMVVLFLSIGLVSWLTMARVVRGQVLSLRQQPFIEAAQALGLPHWRIFLKHLLPNLVGPVVVYATLIVPQAILQESFLSFLGIGIQPPLPTWGSLAGEGLSEGLNPVVSRWWLLVVPCALLGVTLLSLNFLGDGLRDLLDPKRDSAKL
jgi:oligopeptide transport system permease protein